MIPLSLPPTLTGSQQRAVRAAYQVAEDRLHRADQIGDRDAVTWQQAVLAVLAGLLAEGRCPNCRNRKSQPQGKRISLFGVGLGRCCGACSAELSAVAA